MSKSYCIVVKDYINISDPQSLIGVNYVNRDGDLTVVLSYFEGVFFDIDEAIEVAEKFCAMSKCSDIPIECEVRVCRLDKGEITYPVWDETIEIYDNVNYEKFMEVKKNAK